MATSTAAPTIDEARVEEFANRIVYDAAAATVTTLSAVGDRLGLWRALAAGPATSAEIAARSGCVERYVREWAAVMASTGYVEYDPESERFTLPAEHALVLADESTPASLAGAAQLVRGMTEAADGVERAFRQGGGVAIAEYSEHFWGGLERMTGGAFDHELVQQWIPSVEGLDARLREGALVADVGCGSGRALIRLAEAYPNSRFHGYDVSDAPVRLAREAVAAAGVADRVEIRKLDATHGLPERYDLISTFDVIHDSRDPRGLLAAIRGALHADGVYLCLDMASSGRLEDDAGPIGALLYGSSVLFCMTTSLADDGAGRGTCGVHEESLRDLAVEAGFTSVKRIAENPFSHVYEVRP
jgi:SAM-dependent methyltransferase